jgi:zinc protease
MAADRLAVSFELEAERMRRLALPEDEFLKELEVVKEERRLRTDDDPQSLTYEQFNATAYEASPYRIPIIGWPSDLEAMQVDDLRAWYRSGTRRTTRPWSSSATWSRSGLRLAEEHFGPLQPEPWRRRSRAPSREQRGEKRLRCRPRPRSPTC